MKTIAAGVDMGSKNVKAHAYADLFVKNLYGKELGKRLMAKGKGLREKNLEIEGWVKQTTIGEPRLSEIVELYKSLGYEVHLEPVKLEELDEECRSCYESEIGEGKTVYVRKE